MAIDVISELLRKQISSSKAFEEVDSMDIDVSASPTQEDAAAAETGELLLNLHGARKTPPLNRIDPLFSIVNEMREQRMSMVANLGQYRFCHEAVLAARLRDLRTSS
jgi:3-dehydroquinate dehydratase